MTPTATPTQEPPNERAPSELETHPQAGRVPAMPAPEYASLRADIDQRGLQVPLEITASGIVLDGRQRLRAAVELGLERVQVRLVAPVDELDHMLRAAILRRQLTASQKAALVLELELEQYEQLRGEAAERQRANLKQSAEVATSPPRGKTRELAAGWAGVGARTLQDAATVKQHDPQLFEQVKQGGLGAADAARRVRRALRDQALPEPAPLPQGPFELLYADPPWQLGGADSDRAPENHYPTLPLAEIEALVLPAAEDAVLFLWAVSSLLPEALAVMHAWGFAYRTSLVWVKDKIGLGAWVRHRHELLLVGRKGSFPAPDPGDRPDSVIEAARRRHSQKPACVYELLEQMYPRASKLELFARSRRPGWSGWGNQLPPVSSAGAGAAGR
jgi:N6-adenosine-specific RNA methylase IME4/ParB-like chromosome segregation protein Spo0J